MTNQIIVAACLVGLVLDAVLIWRTGREYRLQMRIRKYLAEDEEDFGE